MVEVMSLLKIEHLHPESFRIFEFIDCIHVVMCQPGNGLVTVDDDHNPDSWETQRVFFTNHGKTWAIQYYSIFLPNRTLGNIF